MSVSEREHVRQGIMTNFKWKIWFSNKNDNLVELNEFYNSIGRNNHTRI